MGLINSVLRFLIREHRRKPFRGAALALGRQHLFATYEEVLAMFAQEGVVPAPLPPPAQLPPPARPAAAGERLSDVMFFRMLGLTSLEALDFSAYEGADLIHDLNRPVPEALVGRFDLIIDAGTTEHVFDVRQALTNYGAMLKPGGRIFHSSPANNQVGHGFYQFSPGLYFDYYSANRFTELRGFLIAHDAATHFQQPVEFYAFHPQDQQVEFITSRKQLSVAFLAEKTADSTAGVPPIQGVYRKLAGHSTPADDAATPAPRSGVFAQVKQLVPLSMKQLLRPGWLRVRSLVVKDPSQEPWGLKLWGRF